MADYEQIADINAESLSYSSSYGLEWGAKAMVANIDATSLCDTITTRMFWGAKTEIADINATSLCATITAAVLNGLHACVADINATSYCAPVTMNIRSTDLYVAIDIGTVGDTFIRSPLIRIPTTDPINTARPRAAGSEFRVYLFSNDFVGKALEQITIRYNFDDKRFTRGIYASKAPSE